MSQYPDHARKMLMGYSLRTERYRLVTWVDREVSRTGAFDRSLIDSIELYDYEADPLETVNQFRNPEYKDVLKDLEIKLERYFSTRQRLRPAGE